MNALILLIKLLVLLALVGFVSAINLIGRTQSAAAKGCLKCDGKPDRGIEIKLMDSDNAIGTGFFDTDDLMAKGKTDSDGCFTLSGSTKEITGIDPYLAIKTGCKTLIGSRVIRINLPSSYAFSGETPKKTYDAGNMELAGKFPGETRKFLG